MPRQSDRPHKAKLEQLIIDRGLSESREAGRREILAGNVRVDGLREDKPGAMVRCDAEIMIEGGPRYASRGGEKLAHALDVFRIDVDGVTAVDVGASTGGFTDVLLKRGAARVYCVDVGYGQLAWELRQDPRVVVLDRTNGRSLSPRMFDPRPDFATADVSFISLSRILPALYLVTVPDCTAVCLVKPQFEAGREQVGKHGVVRSAQVHEEVLNAVYGYAVEAGFHVMGFTASPIKGPQGNIEFLMHLSKGSARREESAFPASKPGIGDDCRSVVAECVAVAHESLNTREGRDCDEQGRNSGPKDQA
ncbi:MAG: TlyA family RNA methyltransferase [Clostridia bacterium]|nr:TlyA family RNA methyltransferase [Clostridia bacterium]